MSEAAERRTEEAAHYGDAGAEYEAVRGAAGVINLSSRGRVEVTGAEAVQFLNGMLTNDVAKLEDGAWAHAALPNVQGRLVASARVIRDGDAFIFDTEAATHAALFAALERFTPAGDFRVKDLTEETALLSVQGPRAAEVLVAALGDEKLGRLERGRVAVVTLGSGGARARVIRATHTGEDGFDLFVGAASAPSLRGALTAAGARPVGFDAAEVLRIEAGLPRYGADATAENVVLEVVDEDEAVSYTKGCYVGQEIIARIHWRGHVAKKLAGLVLDGGGEGVRPGARLKSGDGARAAGQVTSVARSPRLGRLVALGIVKYDFLAPGTALQVLDDEEEVCGARVSELPHVRGSWHAASEGEGDGR